MKLISWIASGMLLAVHSMAWAENDLWSLQSRWESAVNAINGDTQTLAWRLQPSWEADWGDDIRSTVRGRFRLDRFDRVYKYSETELYEAYLDLNVAGQHDLRLGKQQIVWGQADGIKVLDVVNPQSYREFVLPDYADSRIPLWSARLQLNLEAGALEFVWLPDITHHRLAPIDSPYAFRSPLVAPPRPSGIPVQFEPLEEPDDPWRDGDAGIRFSALIGDWDVAFSYFYHYLDSPAYRRELPVFSDTPESPVTVRGAFLRDHLFGIAASRAFGALTLRTELGYHDTSFFYTRQVTPANAGVNIQHETAAVIGLDWDAAAGLWLSAQSVVSVISHTDEPLYRDRIERSWTWVTRYDLLHDSLRLENTVLWNQNRKDGVLRPGLRYQIDDVWSLRLGYDRFWGNAEGLYGEFKEQDRWLLQWEAEL